MSGADLAQSKRARLVQFTVCHPPAVSTRPVVDRSIEAMKLSTRLWEEYARADQHTFYSTICRLPCAILSTPFLRFFEWSERRKCPITLSLFRMCFRNCLPKNPIVLLDGQH